jgi:RecB family exonuclease
MAGAMAPSPAMRGLGFCGRRTIRPLSYTQVSLYRSCPLCYKLQYIDGLKTKERGYFSFGTTMHSCAEYFYKVGAPPPPSLEEMLRYYEQKWLSRGYESAEEEARYKAYGREILKKFCEIHSAGFRLPIATEQNFMLDIDGVKLRGFIDRVDKLESGGLAVVDYKTNKDLFTADYLAEDLQLTIYQLAAEQKWRLPVEKLTLYHLRSNTPCSVPPRSREKLEAARNLVLDTAENITAGKFPAIENSFCPCDFPQYCPYYRHKYQDTAPAKAGRPVLPGIAAADAVDRYADLQGRIKDLHEQLEAARQAIIEYCRGECVNRVYGSDNEVTYRLVERTGYSEEDIAAILKPAGLWEKVLGFDQALLKSLLADETLDRETRKKIESLKRVTSSYPQLWLKKQGGVEE